MPSSLLKRPTDGPFPGHTHAIAFHEVTSLPAIPGKTGQLNPSVEGFHTSLEK